MVYVLSKTGQPIMPTENHAKVRLLLKSGKAVVARRTPFTIRLTGASHTYTQPVTLGVDAGSRHIGLSASTEKQELFAAELRPRNDVVGLMSARRQLRRSRRDRTTRYRKPRFENRVHSKNKGWLAPSVEVKIHNHIQGISLVCGVMPVSTIRIETAEFDLQRLKAMEQGKPLPVGTDYQLGEQYDSYNVRQYVLKRDGYTCRCCGKHGEGVKLHVHHIESRQTGGDAPDNLVTLCEDCHRAYHAGKIMLPASVAKRRLKPTRDAVFMGIMRKTLLDRLKTLYPDKHVCSTYGYITKYWREKLDIRKTHISDAFVIAKNFNAARIDKQYLVKPIRSHNRQIHKATVRKGGIRRLNQSPKYVFGYQLFDKVKFRGAECFVFGRRASGRFDLRLLDGTKVFEPGFKRITLLERRKSLLIQ